MEKAKKIKIENPKEKGVKLSYINIVFLAYLIILLWVIVFKCNANAELNIEKNLSYTLWQRFTARIIPFQELYYILLNRARLTIVLAFFFNTIACIPAGMLLGFFLKRRWGLLWSGLFVLGIELFQLFSGWGGFDLTDIFMNLLGVYLGYLIFDFLYKRFSAILINRFSFVCVFISVPIALFALVRTILNFPV